MLKKILSVALALVMIASVAVMAVSCSNNANEDSDKEGTQGTGTSDDKNNADGDKSFKVGFIFLHDRNSTYDLNFINAVETAQKALSLTDSQVIMKTNVPIRVTVPDTSDVSEPFSIVSMLSTSFVKRLMISPVG